MYKLTEREIIDKRPSTDLYDREKNLRKFGHICQLILRGIMLSRMVLCVDSVYTKVSVSYDRIIKFV